LNFIITSIIILFYSFSQCIALYFVTKIITLLIYRNYLRNVIKWQVHIFNITESVWQKVIPSPFTEINSKTEVAHACRSDLQAISIVLLLLDSKEWSKRAKKNIVRDTDFLDSLIKLRLFTSMMDNFTAAPFQHCWKSPPTPAYLHFKVCLPFNIMLHLLWEVRWSKLFKPPRNIIIFYENNHFCKDPWFMALIIEEKNALLETIYLKKFL
jgi:hypothetical protein